MFPATLEAFARALAQAPASWRPVVVPAGQAERLAEVVETILPATGTPGARAARVHEFVDLMLARCVDDAARLGVLRAIDRLGDQFVGAPAASREASLRAMEPEAFGLLKELTLLGYFTSKVGCTEALAYVAVPGDYKGCVPLEPGQKAWATR
jgi:hypothetical protein